MATSDEKRTRESKTYAEERFRKHLRKCKLTLRYLDWRYDMARCAHTMGVSVEERSGLYIERFPEVQMEDLGTDHQIDAQALKFALRIATDD